MTDNDDKPPPLFMQRQRDKEWRFAIAEYQGRERLSIWPFFQSDNRWLPCAARFGGGVQIPLDRVPELIAALQSAIADGGAE